MIINNNCQLIHIWFNELKKYTFPFNKFEIPLNGIYILFEKNELAHSTNRIVRIGSHTGKNQLRSRLFQHFLHENKDRSIFRKNVGRALLNKLKDPFLKDWEIDLTKREAKEKYYHLIDNNYKNEIEKKVTQYIQNNFSFVVFQVDEKDQRLELEAKIISTVSHCVECSFTKNWLGLHSPKEKIRNSGLWLINELYKTPLSDDDMQIIEKIIKKGYEK